MAMFLIGTQPFHAIPGDILEFTPFPFARSHHTIKGAI
jgi:hypothetical protein